MAPIEFESVLTLIDEKNSEDINIDEVFGLDYPKELLY